MIETIALTIWIVILGLLSLSLILYLLSILYKQFTHIWWIIKTYIAYWDKLSKSDRIILAKIIKKLK